MFGINFDALPVAVNCALFALGAVAVWISGTRLALHADALAERTGVGRAFIGLVLLAGITELPECVTSISAVLVGNAPLAVNNLFGGIVMQTAILAIADMAIGKRSLSFLTPKPVLLLQGVLLIVLLAFVLAGIVAGDTPLLGAVGWWTTGAFALYVIAIRLVIRFEAKEQWRAVDLPAGMIRPEAAPHASSSASGSLSHLWWAVAGVSLVILIAGSLLVATAESIADQTGLGSSFVGATLLAATTSLPELSTTLGAVRLGAYSMAFANIFGSNAIMVALLFVSDTVHMNGPILASADRSATFAAAMGIVVTAIYLVGLIMRRQRVLFRMGVDSFVVLLAYAVTLAGLYLLRAG